MQIQNVSYNQNCRTQTSFKSIIPVYHWHKPEEKYIPVVYKDAMQYVKTYQSKLTNILNSHSTTAGKIKQNDFIRAIFKYMNQFDKDFEKMPYVCTFPNYRGGIKTAWNGNVYEIKPFAYIITGQDAVDFDSAYRKPIGYAHKIARQYDDKTIGQIEVDQAKASYGYGGAAYVKGSTGFLRDPVTNKPLELHVIYGGKPGTRSSKVVKLGFFETNGANNPFITNGIM